MIGKDIQIVENCECRICEVLREAEKIRAIFEGNNA